MRKIAILLLIIVSFFAYNRESKRAAHDLAAQQSVLTPEEITKIAEERAYAINQINYEMGFGINTAANTVEDKAENAAEDKIDEYNKEALKSDTYTKLVPSEYLECYKRFVKEKFYGLNLILEKGEVVHAPYFLNFDSLITDDDLIAKTISFEGLPGEKYYYSCNPQPFYFNIHRMFSEKISEAIWRFRFLKENNLILVYILLR